MPEQVIKLVAPRGWNVTDIKIQLKPMNTKIPIRVKKVPKKAPDSDDDYLSQSY